MPGEDTSDQAAEARDVEEGNMASLSELAEKEVAEKTDSQAEAKDKAQIAAATAMLVIHIALLIEVIDKGKENIKYYDVRLVLISIAIAFQVTAGLIALVIANSRKYYKKHKKSCVSEMFECCDYKSTQEEEHERKLAKVVAERKRDAINRGTWDIMQSGTTSWIELGNYDDEIVQNHEIWKELSVLERLASVSPQKDWEACCKRIDIILRSIELIKAKKKKLKIRVEEIKKKRSINSEEEKKIKKFEDLDKEIRDKNRQLEMERSRKAYFYNILNKQSVFRTQGKILSKYASAIRKNRVLKCISAWQHAINYMLYAVFILNVLIAAFGTLNSVTGSGKPDCPTPANKTV